MSDKIVIAVSGNIDARLQQARAAAAEAGGKLEGNSEAGTFAGQTPVGAIKGTYVVAGQNVTITISEKPYIVPVSVIENVLRGYFA